MNRYNKKGDTSPLPGAAYIRYSSEMQNDSFSLDAQLRQIKEQAERDNVEIVKVYSTDLRAKVRTYSIERGTSTLGFDQNRRKCRKVPHGQVYPNFDVCQAALCRSKSCTTSQPNHAGIMEARSPRLSDIAFHMPGQAAASYKRIQRFLQGVDPREALKMLFNDEADFVIGDPTEIERRHADRTEYVGTLMDGQTKGFWMLTLATPRRGRAIPFHFLTYSSRTFEDQPSSRNLEHFKAIQEIQQLIGTRPIVFDREFSYRELLKNLVEEGVHFVIRLNMGANPPHFTYDAEQKRPLRLWIAPINQPKIYRQVYYMGEVCLNVMGIWRYGFKEPMGIMTNMEPEAALALYDQRMKIEICFRDLKSLLHIDKVMHKSQVYLDKMLAYAVSVVVGEAIRDVQYAQADPDELNLLTVPTVERSSGWYLFSGPFLLLKQRYRLAGQILRRIVAAALLVFAHLIYANVRTFVRT